MLTSDIKKGEDYTGICIVYFCHDGAGNFILSKRKDTCRDEHGRWDPGGGGLEFNDTVENTLRQEIAQEYCTDVLSFEFLGYRDVHREHNSKKTHWIALDFKVHVDRSKVKNGEPHKFEKIEWFNLENLPGPVHSQLPHFLEKYKAQLAS